VLVLALVPSIAAGQPMHDHIAIYSTEEGGGQLALDYDFEGRTIQLYEVFCASGECFYSAPQPAFLAPVEDEDPNDDRYLLEPDTRLSVEIVAAAAGATLNVNGQRLNDPLESAVLGTTPDLHVHPSWQLSVPDDQFKEFEISYKVKDVGSRYTESAIYASRMTNLQPTADATPTPTATPQSGECTGDCDGNGAVSIDELILGVNMALAGESTDDCPDFDGNGSHLVEIDELVRAVGVALDGCGAGPTPTFPPVSFAEIQDTIFTPRCAIATCHTGPQGLNDLTLDAGVSYGELVGIAPFLEAARMRGLLRVDPGNPANSFLLVKLDNPPLLYGNQMPIGGQLTPDEIELIRHWILQGAPQ
jgi:hypothetical protein